MPPDRTALTPEAVRKHTSLKVSIRFLLRIAILAAVAIFGAQGFAKTLESLLVVAVCYCLVVGGLRREWPFGPTLTHYDEAAAYAVAFGLASLAG